MQSGAEQPDPMLGVILLAGCGEKAADQAPAAAAPPPAVAVVTTRLADITPTLSFNGRVVAEDKVDLRARVEGFLEKREFTEGADVKEGELLFEIEKDQFQAVVDQAPGRARERRGQPGEHRGRATARRAAGQEQEHPPGRGRPAARRRCRWRRPRSCRRRRRSSRPQINLGYTDITAPIAGRIGRAALRVGNLVEPDERRARDHRQPGPDLRDLPGQPARAAGVPREEQSGSGASADRSGSACRTAASTRIRAA